MLFSGTIGINVTHTKVKRSLQIGLRAWLTDTVIEKWMANEAFLKLNINKSEFHNNPDGRISDDIRSSVDGIINFFDSLFLNILLLGSFTGILWNLSGVIVIGGITIYGYMVWLAVIYAAIASIFGYIASIPLTLTTNAMATAEANFRKALLNIKENCGKIVFNKNEDENISELKQLIIELKEKYNIQTEAWMKIVKFCSGYGVLNMAFPILAAAPHYIANKLTLGGLMQSAQSFSQVVTALSWPVNNMPGIAIWRTSVERVLSLVNDIDKLENESLQ